jgi:hypothetical protein
MEHIGVMVNIWFLYCCSTCLTMLLSLLWTHSNVAATIIDMVTLLLVGTHAHAVCSHACALLPLQSHDRGARVITTDRRLKGPDFSLIKQV